MPRLNILVWSAGVLIIVAGCVSIRTEYPDISYYRLSEQPLQPALLEYRIPAGLWIRPFSVDAEFATERFILIRSDGIVQRLFYHRWVADPANLVTDAIAHRLIRYATFTKGIFRERTLARPRYRLEGRILEFAAAVDEDNDRYVGRLKIYFSLLEYHPQQYYRPILHQLVEVSLPSEEDELELIAPVMSNAVARAVDQWLMSIVGKLQRK